jgi:RNA polymerase sigma-70 factor (ECF subfamily)
MIFVMPPSSFSRDSISSSLLDRLREQDVEAWKRLTDLYGPLVYSWCRRAGLAPADSADVVQEVFIAVSRAIKSFRRDLPQSTFHGWIATITRNKIQDHFRRCATQPLAKGGSDVQQMLQSLAALDERSVSSEAPSAADRRILLSRAIELVRSEFEERTWRAFWLTTVESRLPVHAAEELGISLNSVYKARSRVLRRLREELQGLL